MRHIRLIAFAAAIFSAIGTGVATAQTLRSSYQSVFEPLRPLGLLGNQTVVPRTLQPKASPPAVLLDRAEQLLSQRLSQRASVKCGMTLIPADPAIDPTFAHPVPKDGPKFTIRIIDPPACR